MATFVPFPQGKLWVQQWDYSRLLLFCRQRPDSLLLGFQAQNGGLGCSGECCHQFHPPTQGHFSHPVTPSLCPLHIPKTHTCGSVSDTVVRHRAGGPFSPGATTMLYKMFTTLGANDVRNRSLVPHWHSRLIMYRECALQHVDDTGAGHTSDRLGSQSVKLTEFKEEKPTPSVWWSNIRNYKIFFATQKLPEAYSILHD